ncbi:MAG TPA: succinate--CoA ligase subunit beta, partial [Flavobacteriales bacterium]|nr:succinate--CoA ligase subunit beta [Flavobacteriales bacterium]
MNVHEYQGKGILKQYGVPIQEGQVIDQLSQAQNAADQLARDTGTEWFVVKAQIHAGGRGKGTVKETGSHGVVLAKGKHQLDDVVEGILGGTLVTAQT